MPGQLIRKAAHALGAASVARTVTRSGLRILMYHRFDERAQGLAWQCQHIRRHYQPVSLRQVADAFVHGIPLPPNAVAITIDDGYRDYLTFAHPVFRAYDIPTTVFLISDFMDGRLWPWADQVKYLIAHARPQSVSVALDGSPGRHFAWDSAASRGAASRAIVDLLKETGDAERARTIDTLATALSVELPAAPPEVDAALSWDEVRQLARERVEFGAHTKTHPILSRVRDPRALEDEIVIPKARIEAETGVPVAHFCYPNGRHQDFTEETVAALARAGFHDAVTTERGLNFARAERLKLRRLGVEPDNPPAYFAELLAGLRAH